VSDDYTTVTGAMKAAERMAENKEILFSPVAMRQIVATLYRTVASNKDAERWQTMRQYGVAEHRNAPAQYREHADELADRIKRVNAELSAAVTRI
jgi:hypothetical protein